MWRSTCSGLHHHRPQQSVAAVGFLAPVVGTPEASTPTSTVMILVAKAAKVFSTKVEPRKFPVVGETLATKPSAHTGGVLNAPTKQLSLPKSHMFAPGHTKITQSGTSRWMLMH